MISLKDVDESEKLDDTGDSEEVEKIEEAASISIVLESDVIGVDSKELETSALDGSVDGDSLWVTEIDISVDSSVDSKELETSALDGSVDGDSLWVTEIDISIDSSVDNVTTSIALFLFLFDAVLVDLPFFVVDLLRGFDETSGFDFFLCIDLGRLARA
jgi:hypothetical protein